MDFALLSEDKKLELSKLMLTPLNSSLEIKDWAKFFLDLEIPSENTDPESTSNPLDAAWYIYETFKLNIGNERPGAILISSREGLKCQSKGTKILKKTGLANIEDIEIGDEIWTGFSWQRVKATFDEGEKPAIKVKVEGSVECVGTPIHRYWTLRNGTEQWVYSHALNPETDMLCVNTNTGLVNSKVLDKESYDIGYFLGLLTGDGGISFLASPYWRSVLTTQDDYIKDFYYKFINKYFPEVNVRVKNNGLDHIITNKKHASQLLEWGLKPSRSWEKDIPSFCYSNLDAMKGFIAGLFDTDGSWAKPGDAFIEITAKELIINLQKVLLSFGIDCTIRHNENLYGLQKHKTSKISIGQCEAHKFKELGIDFKAKKARQYIAPKIPNCKDVLPITHVEKFVKICKEHAKRLKGNRKIKRKYLKPRYTLGYNPSITLDKLGRLCLWMEENIELGLDVTIEAKEELLKIKNILKNKWRKFTKENIEKEYFYDLSVENEPSYWSNGLISHNTIIVTILELLLLLHFQLEVGHAAAIESQSSIALGYINGFLIKIGPLLEAAGWASISSNKRVLQYKTPQNKTPYIKVVICSTKGMNGLHSNVLFLDELDLADKAALREGKNIVGFSKGIYGMQVFASSYKYSFGNVAEAIEKADDMNYKILKWNLIDLTERCPTDRHLPNEPKQDMYVSNDLPLRKYTMEEYSFLSDLEKEKLELIKDAHAGCVKCPLLPLCFVPGTPVRMFDGTLKNIEDISPNDLVITHKGNIKKVTSIGNRLYEGTLIELDAYGQNLKTLCTPEHPFLTQDGWKEAKDLSIGQKKRGVYENGDWLITPQCSTGKQQTELYIDIVKKQCVVNNSRIIGLRRSRKDKGDFRHSVPIHIPLNYDWGFICGLYISEGSFAKGTRRLTTNIISPMAVNFSFHKKEQHLLEFVKKFAEKELNSSTTTIENKTNQGVCITINSAVFSELLLAWFGQHCDNKNIPEYILNNYNQEFLRGLFEGIYEGDGKKQHKNTEENNMRSLVSSRVITLANPKLIQQLQVVGWKLGIFSTLSPIRHKSYGGKVKKPTQSLSWTVEKETLYKRNKGYIHEGRLRYKNETFYSGLVYNIEVEDDESYLVNSVAVHNCKLKLADKPDHATGGFYKPISSVIQKFKENDPETAESQLLCRRPGSEGLVYKRFSKTENSITTLAAYEVLVGPTKFSHISEMTLLYEMQRLGIEFYCGVDWGFNHPFVIVVVAKIPNGEWWLIETYSCPELDPDEVVDACKSFRDKYNPIKWFCDTSRPDYMKALTKNGMRTVDFKKDVLAGISAVRSKIVNSNGRRSLKILATEGNKKTFEAIAKHKFQLDAQGNVTPNPDDEPIIADVCFVPGTLIYTKNGIKPIELITIGDEVLTHTGNFEKVKDTMSREYDGDILSIQANGKPNIKCTPNHPFYMSKSIRCIKDYDGSKLTGQRRVKENFEFKPASELLKYPVGNDRKTKPIPVVHFPRTITRGTFNVIDFRKYVPEWTEKGEELHNAGNHNGKIKSVVELTQEISFLMGYFVAEGSLSGNGSGVYLAGHQKETRVVDLLAVASKQMGINAPIWRPNKKGNGRNIVISSKPLHNFLSLLSSDKDKKFHNFVHDLSRQNIMALLAGYFFGDGHIKKNGLGIVSNSISENISFTVHALLVQLGYRPTIRIARRKGRYKGFGKNGLVSNDYWIISLSSEDSCLFLEEAFENDLIKSTFLDKINEVEKPKQSSHRQEIFEDGLSSTIREVSTEKYSGLVYNIEVENDSSYVANSYTVHNCDSIRYIGQNLWPIRGSYRPSVEFTDDPGKAGQPAKPNYTVNEQMREEIVKRLAGSSVYIGTSKKKGGFHFSG